MDLDELAEFAKLFRSESKKTEERQEKQTHLSKEDEERLRKEAEIDALQTENDIRKEELKGKIQDREQRKEFAIKIYHFLCFYLSSVLFLVILSATPLIKFELTEGIIITLLTTTTANIIGIFILVVKYLFATRK
ncbi:hypothetical protein [Bacteroides clarus]|jgi:hypothetical protein|uniref:Uncharacterized protein n=1 Tax=Bacteroides clarus TaxID=626929 RepID=A0A1Y3YQY0_9BACE|nr:hypothetical protein [Bacteroides clarus]OUN97749.1 hypothetical protein B5F97_17370 [Bacteroides clarus]